ncbi:MAG: prolyl-tRNA synthetase associated domain-containing protein [Candidatus Promineifilaceae bacterium]
MDIFAFLQQHNIEYDRVDHPPVYTVAEAQEKVPPIAGAETKNLFIRTKKGNRHFLVVIGYDKSVDLKKLAAALGVKRLGFASPDRLMTYLGIKPGSVSLLAILNDTDAAVEVIVDRAVWDADRLKCHPLVNTNTLSIARSDVERIFEITNHTVTVIDVPQRIVA